MEHESSEKPATSPIALVFTDMVGSSAAKRAASLGGDSGERDAAFLAGIQIRHFKVVRDCMNAHGGTEIMTIGDAFFLTFPDVDSAVRCCAEIQMCLKSQPIMTAIGPMQLRIGIHCGTPKFVDNSWHGKDVEIAGKVESSGSATQIILSEPARKLMGDVPGVALHPLGTFLLKDTDQVPLWDVDYDGAGPRLPQVMSIEETRRLARKRLLWRGGIASLLLIVLLSGWLWYRHRQLTILKANDKVVLTAFNNQTGDPSFDGAMQQALTMELDQSPFLRLVSGEELRAGLRSLKQGMDQPVTAEIACKLSPDGGIKAYVTGSIGRQGAGYTVALDAHNCATGESLGHAKDQAPDKDHVLSALSRAASSLRRDLGEHYGSVKKYATLSGEASGPDLMALQAFARAERGDGAVTPPQALGFYRQATELFPGFAWAYARIGMIDQRLGRTQDAINNLAKAYDLREHATQRQRLTIEAQLFEARGNLPAAIAANQSLLKIYPQDADALASMGKLYTEAGDEVRAAPYFQRAVDAAPWDRAAADQLAGTWLVLNNTSKAKEAMDASAALSMGSNSNLESNRVFYAFETGDADWKRFVAPNKDLPDSFIVEQSVSNVLYRTGQLSAARTAVEQAVASALGAGSPIAAGKMLADAALFEAGYGVCTEVPAMTKRALAYDASAQTLPAATIAQLLCGPDQGSLAALNKLAQEFPENTRLNDIYLAEASAAVALLQHRPEDVSALLESTRPYRVASLSPTLEAEALLEMNRPAEALAILAPVLRSPFNGMSVQFAAERPRYGMALLLAGRAHAMAGDNAHAIENFNGAIDVWKHADPGFAPLREAVDQKAAIIAGKPL
jgi:eukaryotic-like serine/threonine-protein kinase